MTGGANKKSRANLIAAAVLLAASLPLLFISLPTFAEKWEYMDTEQQVFSERQVQIDPGELLKTMEDDLIKLIMIDVRDESSWNRFHLQGARRVPVDQLQTVRRELLAMPGNPVIVVMCNDEIDSSRAWKLLVAMGVSNVYILAGGINTWLDVYGHAGGEAQATHGDAEPNGRLRHEFPKALGDRHPAARPDSHHAPKREFTPLIKLVKKVLKSGGCG